MFVDTALAKKKELVGCKGRMEDQCTHGCVDLAAKAPVRMRARLSTNVPLRNSAKQYRGNHSGRPYGSLTGKGPATGLPCTAVTAVYPHGLVQDLVADFFSFICKFQKLWSGRRCQYGFKGGEHTFAPGGCRYGAGEFEHHKPAPLHRDELGKQITEAILFAPRRSSDPAGRKSAQESPSHANEPKGPAGGTLG